MNIIEQYWSIIILIYKNQLYIAVSLGGILESTDYGKSWSPLNKGIPKNNYNSDYQYDTHSITLHPTKPNKLFQQNKLGIYKIELLIDNEFL